MRRMITVAVVLLAAVPAAAQGPSFDCSHATRADEKAICRSPALSAQDAKLADLFSTITGCLAMGSRDVERGAQGQWLKHRAACGANSACLARLYRARIREYAPRAAKAKALMAKEECPGPV